jgi:hypothetical protein
MRQVGRTLAAIRFALSTRRDLLLEILALRHQLVVLARSNRRFRPSDRLLWLILRRMWPRWRDAMVLVQPATVDRWHRDRLDPRWWRRSRRPGRPRIDSRCRDLIGRLAEENRLWGAPRIHGELLKLGVVVSERTVSRYLSEQPKRPSQTWRTFVANHLGQFTFNSQVLSPDVSGDDLVDATARTRRSISSSDSLTAPRRCALFHGIASARRPCLDLPCTQGHLRDRTGMRRSAGRAPPRTLCLQPTHGGWRCRSSRTARTRPTATVDERETFTRRRSRSVQTSSGRWPSSFGLRWTPLPG